MRESVTLEELKELETELIKECDISEHKYGQKSIITQGYADSLRSVRYIINKFFN